MFKLNDIVRCLDFENEIGLIIKIDIDYEPPIVYIKIDDIDTPHITTFDEIIKMNDELKKK